MNSFLLPFASLVLLLSSVLTGTEPLDLPKDIKANPAEPENDQRLSANRKFFKAKRAIEADYRTRLADIIGYANRVELFLLDFEPTSDLEKIPEPDRFYVTPYKSAAKILNRVKAKPDVADLAKQHFQRLLRTREDREGGALCHMPVHGVRFFKDNNLLFQTSLCWMCSNYFVTYPDDYETATWVGMHDEALKAFFLQQMPIPADLRERFETTYPSPK